VSVLLDPESTLLDLESVLLDPKSVLLDPESVSSSSISISVLSSASHHCDFGLESGSEELAVEVAAVPDCVCVTVGDQVYAFLAFTPISRSRGRSTFVSSNLRSCSIQRIRLVMCSDKENRRAKVLMWARCRNHFSATKWCAVCCYV
jgi:hypothetical protein